MVGKLNFNYMENQQQIKGFMEGMSPKTASTTDLIPKFSDKGYTEGEEVRCSIDKMDNNKWCVYHYVNRGYKAGQSYRVYKQVDDFLNDFEVKKRQIPKKKIVSDENE